MCVLSSVSVSFFVSFPYNDGDLHIALQDATRDELGVVVVVEMPAQPQWCEIRTTVFSWTPTRFPFHTGSGKKLTFGKSPIIIVVGKAMWDVGHVPKDQSRIQL